MLLTIDNTTQPITEWAADYGIPVSLIRSRLRRGWSEERAVTEPMIVRRGEELPADAMLDLPPKPRPIVPSPFLPLRFVEQPVTVATRRPFRKSAHTYEHNGLTLTVEEWAQRVGISKQAMHMRIKKCASLEIAFTSEDQRIHKVSRQLEHDGLSLSVGEWAQRLGIHQNTIYRRLRLGASVAEALATEERRGRPSGSGERRLALAA